MCDDNQHSLSVGHFFHKGFDIFRYLSVSFCEYVNVAIYHVLVLLGWIFVQMENGELILPDYLLVDFTFAPGWDGFHGLYPAI